MKALKAIVGVILLLPGICSLGFMVALGVDNLFQSSGGGMYVIWLPCFAVSALGIWLIKNATRR